MLMLNSFCAFLRAPFLMHFDLGGGGGSAPAPDPNIGVAAQQNAEVAKDALAFNKQVYEDNKPRQALIDEYAKRIVDQQLAVGDTNQAQAGEQWNRFKTLFAPVEEQMVKDATEIDSVQNQELEAGKAGSQVAKSYAQANEQQTRNLASMGINPNSGRALAAKSTVGAMEAADEASAMNNARQIVKDKGITLRAGAANFGRNMPNTASNAYGLTLTAGNSAGTNSAAGMNAAIAGAGQMNQGFGTAIQGNNSAGSILNQQFSNQVSAYNAQQQADAASSAGFGNMIGTLGAGYMKTPAGIAMFSSSKKIKTNKKPIDDADTLDKVIDLPVEDWKYVDGEGDGGEHIGAYAEDVQKKFGDKAAPGGKAIDIISMHGITLSAVKGLAKTVGKLENKVENIAARGIGRA
jgi:hypothetical protein